MATPYIPVPAPQRKARVGGIRTVVEFIEVTGLGKTAGIEWESALCGKVEQTLTECYGQAPRGGAGDALLPKDNIFGPEWARGEVEAFAGYTAVQCTPGSGDDFQARARELLEAGEDYFVEGFINTWLAANAIIPGVQPFASITAAVAAAERYADGLYRFRPIIWMNRGDVVTARAAKAVLGEGDDLHTANGTPVVASEAFTAGELYVTGAVIVGRSPVVTFGAVTTETNEEWGVSEAVWAAGFDCLEPAKFDFTA